MQTVLKSFLSGTLMMRVGRNRGDINSYIFDTRYLVHNFFDTLGQLVLFGFLYRCPDADNAILSGNPDISF